MGRPRKSMHFLPKYLHKIGKSYWLRPPGRRGVNVGHDLNIALEKYEQAAKREYSYMNLSEIPALMANIQSNAKARNLPVGITIDDLWWLWERSGGRCEVTGIPFESVKVDGQRRRPWIASVDRIDSRLGYTPENVRLVCAAANFAMGEWGESALRRLAKAYGGFNRPQKYPLKPDGYRRPEGIPSLRSKAQKAKVCNEGGLRKMTNSDSCIKDAPMDTQADDSAVIFGAGCRNRTRDLLITNQPDDHHLPD